MSYTPTEWVTGDTITAEKLNNMEQGIASAGGGLVAIPYTATEGGIALGMTAQQILDGLDAGTMYMVNFDVSEISGYTVVKGKHIIYAVTLEDSLISVITYSYTFSAETVSDYPTSYFD